MSKCGHTICQCTYPGMSLGGTTVTQLSDGTWLAETPIEALFGMEVHGYIQGHGLTKEAALRALEKDREKTYESLWY